MSIAAKILLAFSDFWCFLCVMSPLTIVWLTNVFTFISLPVLNSKAHRKLSIKFFAVIAKSFSTDAWKFCLNCLRFSYFIMKRVGLQFFSYTLYLHYMDLAQLLNIRNRFARYLLRKVTVELYSASSRTRLRCATASRKGAFIATQLNSTQLGVELSIRHVHSVNNSHRSVLNVVTQLTQFVGHGVIYDVFWRVWREMEFWSEEFEEKLIELWRKKTCLFIWHIVQSLQRPCKKAAALENIYQEMNVADWLSHITMQHWEHV